MPRRKKKNRVLQEGKRKYLENRASDEADENQCPVCSGAFELPNNQ